MSPAHFWFGQCYVTVPFMLFLEMGLMMSQVEGAWFKPAGAAVILIGYSWYASTLMRGFMFHRGITRRRARRQVLAAVLLGTTIFLIITIVAYVTTSRTVS